MSMYRSFMYVNYKIGEKTSALNMIGKLFSA